MNSPEVSSTILKDPADIRIFTYSGHTNIKVIWGNILLANPFTSSEITESNIVKEILKLNAKRPGMFKNIPTKVLKKSSEST